MSSDYSGFASVVFVPASSSTGFLGLRLPQELFLQAHACSHPFVAVVGLVSLTTELKGDREQRAEGSEGKNQEPDYQHLDERPAPL